MTLVLVSWGIAFFEYWLQVPGNRGPRGVFARQLKGMQEVITLVVFAVFLPPSGPAAEVQPLGGLRAHRGGGVADVQGIPPPRCRTGKGPAVRGLGDYLMGAGSTNRANTASIVA